MTCGLVLYDFNCVSSPLIKDVKN